MRVGNAMIAMGTAGVFLAVFFGLQASGQGVDQVDQDAALQGCVRDLVGVDVGSAAWYGITAEGRVNLRDMCAGRAPTAWR